MTRGAAQQRLLLRLANRPDVTTTLLDTWLNEALAEFTTQRMEIQELQRVGAAIATQIGVAAYTRPSDSFAIRYIEDITNKRVFTRFPGEIEEFLRSKQNAASGKANQFIEWGDQFYILAVPNANDDQLIPWYYALATWGAGATEVPSIRSTWDRGLLLTACKIAFQDLGDEERAVECERELIDWMARRDTPIRQQRRFTAPTRGIQPASRDPRTGI